MTRKIYLVETELGATIEVRIDPHILTDEWMEDFRGSFYPYHNIEAHVNQLAYSVYKVGGNFIEGYGSVKTNPNPPPGAASSDIVEIIDKDGNVIGEAIVSIIQYERDDWDASVTEVDWYE